MGATAAVPTRAVCYMFSPGASGRVEQLLSSRLPCGGPKGIMDPTGLWRWEFWVKGAVGCLGGWGSEVWF